MFGLTPDKQTVIGALKATNSKDSDVLYAAKEKLKELAKGPLIISWIVTGIGIVMTLTVFLAIIGVPFVLVSWWVRRTIKKNYAQIDQTYQEYLTTINQTSIS